MKTYSTIISVFLCCSPSFTEGTISSQNQNILNYIGEAVIHIPLEKEYQSQTLMHEFKAACDKANAKLGILKVDTSEYPYLIYGAWKEESKYTELRPILAGHKPNTYSFRGSVGGSKYFAVNITPYKAYPPEKTSNIVKRTGIRLSMLYDSLKNN